MALLTHLLTHQVGCGGNGDRISRHNSIHDVPPSQPPSKNLVPNSQSRPADILNPNRSRCRPAALDVHVISPLQRQTLGQAASTPGHALEVGTRRKLASHLSACHSVGVEFIPLQQRTNWQISGILGAGTQLLDSPQVGEKGHQTGPPHL